MYVGWCYGYDIIYCIALHIIHYALTVQMCCECTRYTSDDLLCITCVNGSDGTMVVYFTRNTKRWQCNIAACVCVVAMAV